MHDTQKKYTYASIVPLIGGESLGVMEALDGQLPEYVLSYSPFASNDEHYIQYIRNTKGWTGDYIHLDKQPDYVPASVDVVNSVCPCAGLSSLSTASGADSAVNEWLYTTAEYVLGTVAPKVFWGENAPRLYSNMGKKVADRLFAIGEKHGYSLNLYYTESRLHGLSQKRGRTFYFFTKSTSAPIFSWFNVPGEPIENIFNMAYAPGDPMNISCNEEDPNTNGWAAYAMHKTGTKDIKELYDSLDDTQNLIVWADGGLGDDLLTVAKWMDENGYHKTADRARGMAAKRAKGMGYWAHGITMVKGIIPSLIGALPFWMINPFTQSFPTIRDCLRVMKMPEDFNLASLHPLKTKINHICQNVPVSTARDMMLNVVKYLDGDVVWSESNYTKQSNKNQSVEYPTRAEPNNSHELDEFFSLHSKKNLL